MRNTSKDCMIKNIIFDLGGVIMTIDQNMALSRFKAIGLVDADKFLNPYTQSGIFGDVEEGKITADEFRIELGHIIGREISYDECKYCWLGYRKEVPSRNLDLLKHLRSNGYRLILLSNTNPFMMSWALTKNFDGGKASLDDYFDSLYLSYRLGVMKPDQKFFQIVLENEHILPEESLFVDDGLRNIEVADRLGFNTICPQNGADWTLQLMERLSK